VTGHLSVPIEDPEQTAMIPEGKYADIGDGLQVHYHEAGEGEPVVFVHGSGPGASGYSNFKGCMEAFAARGYRAIAPDTIGYGYSSREPDIDYGFDLFVDGLKRFLDTLGIEKCSLVGNSMGGAMCIRFALDNPDRVDKLIMMAPGGMEVREVYMGMRGIRRMLKALFGGSELSLESMKKVFELQIFKPEEVSDDVIAERLAMAKTQPRKVFERMKVPNLEDEIANLECPIMVFWGQNDQFCPVSGAAKFAERCSNTRVLTITECGHWVMVEHPELFNKTSCDFLDE
jgi:4,5:9,10-diseco-3-hydroxy-5,9,17-trioxoandrosta-1(10),2-diene-4-oate hydrolase